MDFGPYSADVVSIHDGDTITVDVLLSKRGKSSKVDVDLGFNVWRTKRGTELRRQSVRLVGCDAPELRKPGGVEARDYLATLVAPGDPVSLVSHGWDKFGGRIDGSVSYRQGRDLSAAMIAAGHARSWDGKGPKPW